jgi:hypothetical protein
LAQTQASRLAKARQRSVDREDVAVLGFRNQQQADDEAHQRDADWIPQTDIYIAAAATMAKARGRRKLYWPSISSVTPETRPEPHAVARRLARRFDAQGVALVFLRQSGDAFRHGRRNFDDMAPFRVVRAGRLEPGGDRPTRASFEQNSIAIVVVMNFPSQL